MRYSRITILIVLMAFLSGCKYFNKKGVIESNLSAEEIILDIPVPEDSENGVEYETEIPPHNGIETFYYSLPKLEVPLSWDSAEFLKGVPVPEIYRSQVFGLDYPIEVITAVRLPEKDGIRSIVLTKDDEDGFQSQILYLFRAGIMEPTYMQYIYNVREIDGGQNNIITSFEIDRLMGFEIKTIYAGQVENGEFGRVLFSEDYRTITKEGQLETLINMEYGVVSYTEEEETVFGESFPSYKFTVSNQRLCLVDEDDPDTYEFREVEVRRYIINDEGWLVAVDNF